VVDDAIVMLENITRYIEEAKTLAAAFKGASESASPSSRSALAGPVLMPAVAVWAASSDDVPRIRGTLALTISFPWWCR